MVHFPQKKHSRLIEYVRTLQDKGRLTFTKAEATRFLGISQIAFNRAAERLIDKRQLIHPSRGFFVIVPAEFRSAGTPPVSWFIDEFMKFHEQSYYVGVLSAASLYGAAHQAPHEFQVITTAPLRTIRAGRARVHFLTKKGIERTPIQSIRTPYGDIPVSTPESTVFDLIRYVHHAGGLSNVATILIELSEKLNAKKLAIAAKANEEIAAAQRVGYLLDTFAAQKLTLDLHDWLEKCRPCFASLRPNWKSPKSLKLKKEEKWSLIVNEVVEPDI